MYDPKTNTHIYEHNGRPVDLHPDVVKFHARESVGTIGRDLILAMLDKIQELESVNK